MVIKTLESGMQLFSKNLHYHSSICLQVVVRRSLNQPEEAEESAYMRNCEKKLNDQLDPLIYYGAIHKGCPSRGGEGGLENQDKLGHRGEGGF